MNRKNIGIAVMVVVIIGLIGTVIYYATKPSCPSQTPCPPPSAPTPCPPAPPSKPCPPPSAPCPPPTPCPPPPAPPDYDKQLCDDKCQSFYPKEQAPTSYLEKEGYYPGYMINNVDNWCCADESGCPYDDTVVQCPDVTKSNTMEGCLDQLNDNYVLAQWEGGAVNSDGKEFDSCLLWAKDSNGDIDQLKKLLYENDKSNRYGFASQFSVGFPTPQGKGPTKITRMDQSLFT